MNKRVVINMKNDNALCTISMLSALLETGTGNYLDLLTPFVLHSLPKSIDAEISVEQITNAMCEFGFKDFPYKTTEKILTRLSKEDADIAYVYMRKSARNGYKKKFYVARECDNSEFDANKRAMREKIDRILAALQGYFENHYHYKTLSYEVLKSKLSQFFETNGFTVIENVQDLDRIKKEFGSDSFEIAQFILDEAEKRSLIFEDLCEVTKGFLTYKAIYYFTEEHKTSMESKFQNVIFYLDCSLVLDALGYDTAEDERSIKELIRLIRRNGGQVKVFRHTTDEAAKLIEAFANQPHNHNNFSLDGLAKRNWPKDIILNAACQIPEYLKQNPALQIETVDAPTLVNESMYKYELGEEDIVNWLKRNRPKSGNYGNDEERYRFDANSLIAIGMLRLGSHPLHIERAKALLVTQDGWLAKCLHELYGEQLKSEVSYTISDTELVSLLWVRDYKEGASALPSEMLIANAHAACRVSNEVMTRAIEIANTMASDGYITVDAALLVSTHLDFKYYLAEQIRNDVSKLSENEIRNVIDGYIETKSQEKILNAQKTERERSEHMLAEEYKKSNAIQDELNKMLNSKDLELNKANTECQRLANALQMSQKEAHEKEVNRAKTIASKLSNTIFWSLNILLLSIGIVLVIIFAIHCWNEYIAGDSWLPYLIIDILGFIGIPTLILAHKSPCYKLICRIRDHIYARLYSYFLNTN